MAERRIRVLVADDHPVVREGLAAMLETQADVEVVGEAADGFDAVLKARELRPDVILMDLQMPKLDGASAISRIREEQSDAKVIILTTYDTEEHIFRGLQAGARGYLLKGASRDEVFKAVRAAYRGDSLLEPVVAGKLLDRFRELSRGGVAEGLTDRELEVLKLMAAGLRNKEIARKLFVTEKTIKAHVSSILKKLDVGDRTEAVTAALRRGIITL